MSDRDDRSDEADPSADELDLSQLTDEIVDRYDPEKLLKTVSKRAGKGEPLDLATRNRFERRLGVDLSDVRIYTGEFAREVNVAQQANALTIGTTGMIFMGQRGEKSPMTSSGVGLLAHELTHVAQGKKQLHKDANEAGGGASYGDVEEEAAEHQESQVKAEEMGSDSPKPQRRLTAEQYLEILSEAVTIRCLEIFDDDHRIMLIRKGKTKYRP